MGIHNANKVLLGSTRSSCKDVGNRNGSIAAGTAVRLKSDGTLSLTKADGLLLGVSLGRDLSAIGRTAIAYKGVQVPILLTASYTPTLGAVVYIDDATGKAATSSASATAVNAVFTGLLTDGAIDEDGGSVRAALIDFPGGL